MKYALPCIVVAFLSYLSMAAECDQIPLETRNPIAIADLAPTMDRKEIAIKFTVDDLHGIAGSSKSGQAPSFAIDTKSEHGTKRLGVWIEGTLANVLDRLQMSCYQTNQLKKGTVIEATGVVRIHDDKSDGESYTLHVCKWQAFRIVPPVNSK